MNVFRNDLFFSPSRKMKRIFSLFLLFYFVGLCLFSCQSSSSDYQVYEGSVFHTYFRMVYKGDRSLQKVIDKALEEVNASANAFDSTSLLYAINHNQTEQADSMLLHLISLAREVNTLSQGAYDVTAAPLINAWGFGFSAPIEMTLSRVDSLLSFVGMDKLQIEGMRVVKKDPRVMLNLSSIAKGFASDWVAVALEREGVENYMIEIGGEIAYKGVNPNGMAWSIGLSKPIQDSLVVDPTLDMEAVLKLSGKGGLATSGNYRNYKKDSKSGRIYGHTVSPITGYPVQQDVLSATVLAPTAALADALATAFMAVGSQKAQTMAQSLPRVEYFLILPGAREGTFETLISPGLKHSITDFED